MNKKNTDSLKYQKSFIRRKVKQNGIKKSKGSFNNTDE